MSASSVWVKFTPHASMYVRSPFPPLRLKSLLNHGGQAVTLAFPGRIAFKAPIRWGLNEQLSAQAKRVTEIEQRVAGESSHRAAGFINSAGSTPS